MLALTITTMLSACSSGNLVPPNSIDSGTQVGAISPVRGLPREPLSNQPYPMNSAPVSQASTGYLGSTPNGPRIDAYTGDSGHYLRAPDQVQNAPLGAPMAAPANTQQMASRQGRLPMIDSDEAMQAQGRQPGLQSQRQMAGIGRTSIPDEGVNMDSELGFGPDESDITGLAEEQDTDIAEGIGNQPVVDGIGTDSPRALAPRRGAQPLVQPQPKYQQMAAPMADDRVVVPPKRSGAGARGDGIQGDYANGGMTWGDGSRVAAPSRVPTNRGGMQEVAMIRPNNPAPSMTDGPMSQRDDSWIRGVMPQSEVSCRAELRRLGVEFEDRPRIAPGGSCGIDYPVKLSGLSGNIDVKPAVTLNCQTTLAFAKWVKNELAPSARLRYLTGVRRITPLGGYSCRRMNNSSQRYNPMSEHAKGNAIDIGAITLKDGHDIDVRKKGFFSMREGALLKSVRSDSCKYFNTVLGPGSNAEHWNHFHFDLRSRNGGKRYCD